jgi:hypothetical protein
VVAGASGGQIAFVIHSTVGEKGQTRQNTELIQRSRQAATVLHIGLTPKEKPATDELQWHLLSYLGTHWAKADGPKNSDKWMIDYIQTVNEQGGVVTMDVNVSDDGTVYTPHLEQLRSIAKAIRLD